MLLAADNELMEGLLRENVVLVIPGLLLPLLLLAVLCEEPRRWFMLRLLSLSRAFPTEPLTD